MIHSRRLMAILAHPDDESFCIGGTLAKYADEGVQTTLICATRGEAGKCGEPPLCRQEELGAFREAELRQAAQILKINQLHFLPFRDKELAEADEAVILPMLVKHIRTTRPQVVTTFGPDGLTCHRDHVAISHFATRAYHLAADRSAYPELGEPWQGAQLYYTGMPCSYVDAFGVQHCVARKDSEVSAAIPVGDYLMTKRAAIYCHRTQSKCIRELERLTDFSTRDEQRLKVRDYEYFFQPQGLERGAKQVIHDLFDPVTGTAGNGTYWRKAVGY
ncbi:PIG-L family deacetylase [Heliobacterium chlorum]|uniref:PIG-L family deacetylase n=1 Tax=Heliobacterium chlorum TaxID=2698 RepID=A0ABR7T4M1_HELCL|nr:PIG-L deacetylase family protein [Heliobacterium chlorum]MBC9785728.1 PIG-L family deacetylase [Heliobacterium chlorum]